MLNPIKLFYKYHSKITLIALLLTVCFFANAQKLPNKQEVSLRAPAGIRIDGKATEWGNKFQAYNHATEIFYTIANDDGNIYLVVKAIKPDIINKILLGGITFTVSSSGKKNDKEGVAVTFPTFYKNKRPYINLKNRPELTKDTMMNKMQADSFMRVVNKELTDKSKEIEIEGVKSIPDSVISIYNAEGFKAIALFDKQINYTSELAIPIKYLGLSIDKPIMFKYNIKLNGATANGARMKLTNNGKYIIVTRGNDAAYAIPSSPEYMSYSSSTDLSGEYTLAKK
ncbi:hypothetical protein [Mucilaginibacter arboris]|uniref:Uncharacterized protein n=1 Tax=Mucilaginibacter arboris TaxID=2682090 RepID=A0A7K1SWC2_9SPHI|nr:hypothetical protein [Mucilaginibacter arboris]MVN21538.1 hypothetical protein [Mucilaginibacter arboris]